MEHEREQARLGVTDRFDPAVMQELMRHESIYWMASDALAPQPEEMDFVEHLAHPDVFTFAATIGGNVFGYVQFVRRTSIGAEIHVGFLPQFRGRIAKTVVQHAIACVFVEKKLFKLWAIIPSDNRAAIWLARSCGFAPEGRLTRAIVRPLRESDRRGDVNDTPLRDLLILSLSR